MYGAYREGDGTSERALFVLDQEAVIHWSYISPVGVNPGADGILRARRTTGKAGSVMTISEWEAVLALPVEPARDHIRGPRDAPVSLVEYGDYECPYCGAAYPIVEEIIARMGETLQFVYRHFPMTTVHPHAEQAAEAAEAAGAQRRFWEMHSVLFGNQQHLDTPCLHAYAEALGLDVGRFDRELAHHVHADRVREDFLSGVRSGVGGTPTFYINGVRHDGSYDLPVLLDALQRAARLGA
jgi:protein-disulfide isomerase